MPTQVLYDIGQRVRINQEDDDVAPGTYAGKMATIKGIEISKEGEPACVLKVDRLTEPVSFPQSYLKPLVTYPSSLLANDLFLPWDMDDPKLRLRTYTEDRSLAGHLLETLVFYDRLIVPTVDYSIVVPLVHWLGVRIFRDMLLSEALSFVRYRGGLGYAGNGNGLVTFELYPPEDKEDEWWVRAGRCPPQEAVILQIQNRLSGLKEDTIDLLGKLVEICTVDTALPEFTQKVEHETYMDILGSDVLQTYFSMRNTNLKHLNGLEPNQMRVFSSISKPAVAGDEIDVTLSLAMLNLESYLAEECGARDMVTDRQFGRLLEAKVQRFTGGKAARDSFSNLVTIEGLPDLGSAITGDEIRLLKAWDFRNTKVANQFREWFDENGPADPTTLAQEYVKTLKDGGFWDSRGAKLIRFLVVQMAGTALIPVAGPASIIGSMALSAADSFLIDKVGLGFRPRYFIDDLRHKLFSP